MSIILKGIDLPRNGDCHHITIYDNGEAYITTSNRLYETDRKDVEVIQIPTPHGSLIDADALKESIEEVDRPSGYTALVHIHYAPTILESEE